MRSILLSVAVAALGAAAAAGQPASPPAPRALAEGVRDFRDVAERVRPALVQVLTTAETPRLERGGLPTVQYGTGSGVVLDPAGYIVTNAHVVQGARRIQVVLGTPARPPDGRSVLKARGRTAGAVVVGLDVETDLAVLKVAETGLAALELADSEAVRQGQVVLAFGSPLGLENSLTMGVVSAVARQLRPEDPMIYIQTDAPINPGNSGGPLVDLEGRLVGINTLILSQSGGSEGIGFAAPSNIVRNVFDQIRRTGRVRRSHVGVRAQTITPALAAGLGLPREWGAVLADVVPGGPGQRAGLVIGDVVVTLDGKPIENARQLEVNVYQREPGRPVSLEVLRSGRPLLVRVEAEERPDDPARFSVRVDAERDRVLDLGILALDLDDKLLALLPPLRARAGVVVAAAAPDARPSADPLLPGDVIYTANGRSVAGVAPLREAVAGLPSGAAIVLQVERAGALRYVVVEKE
jgi:serine protease Do